MFACSVISLLFDLLRLVLLKKPDKQGRTKVMVLVCLAFGGSYPFSAFLLLISVRYP